MIKKISLLIFILTSQLIFSQMLDGDWLFSKIQNNNGLELFKINKSDIINFNDGNFNYSLKAKDLIASGSYTLNENELQLQYSSPNDSLRKFKILEFSENKLELSENNLSYKFVKKNTLIPSQGISPSGILKGILGMISLIFIAFLFSKNRRGINWKTVLIGLAAQFLLAVGVLKVNFIKLIFEFFGKIFVKTLDFTIKGSEFLLGEKLMSIEGFGYVFLFQVLPTVIFFSALTSVLFYLGIIQKFVKGLAWALTKLLNISGAESLSVAGNIFLGQTEAPLMIKAYLEKMSKSEILLVMVGGMATVAGGVMAAYIGFLGGEDEVVRLFYAKHLLTASVMAAPGAIVISKILYPQTEKINTEVHVSKDKIGSNLLDAIANGTTEGLKLAANVGAMLLVFIAFIAMINFGFEKIGGFGQINSWINSNTPYDQLSLQFILGYVFSPLMWLIGVAREDMASMGQLLGIKLAVSEFIAYEELKNMLDVKNLIHLKYKKSIIMATYMLCGFANFASIGIQIGGIGSLAPGQRKNLSQFGFLALVGGTLASLLSATFAGMIIG